MFISPAHLPYSVKKKIFEFFRPPSRLVDGKKILDVFYFNQEEMKLRLFCESIDWDKEIVDLLLHEKMHGFRNSICEMDIGTLIYNARGKK